jgi:hypothetical protein
MFIASFNPVETLAGVNCPRCHALGLAHIDGDTYRATLPVDRHQATVIINPGVYCQCPACGLVAEWPACAQG